MIYKNYISLTSIFFLVICGEIFSQTTPSEINFVRKGVQRMIFDEDQSIVLASLNPSKIVGLPAMHSITYYEKDEAEVSIEEDQLHVHSETETQTSIWFGGFNPFATFSIDLAETMGKGEVGFEFSNPDKSAQCFIKILHSDSMLTDVRLLVLRNSEVLVDHSLAVNVDQDIVSNRKVILQMLGSGLTLYLHAKGLPKIIAQGDFNKYTDLRTKEYINTFQSHIYAKTNEGGVKIRGAEMALTTGVGLADIRAITYENGDPLLDQGRLWYTMSIRGRALPHHTQGIFSMNPSVFDLKLEGVLLFDREDGLLRNEIASHLFYDRNDEMWRGMTTGFSAFANPEKEKKQLLAIESKVDPRFGFSVMKAVPFGMVGDIEDPHIIYDTEVSKWRIFTCENHDGYKAVLLESDHWDREYSRIAGPVDHNSTGTSIQKIGDKYFCFSGSSERKIWIYTYPELKEAGNLKMDLPPWSEKSRTRVWPNVVQLPEGYPVRYVALMMDRFNYPGMAGPHWSYGAVYLYHGYD